VPVIQLLGVINNRMDTKSMYCCEMMEENSVFSCDTCKDEFECPDSLIYHDSNQNEFGVIIHDGGSSFTRIEYCPWCGSKLNVKSTA